MVPSKGWADAQEGWGPRASSGGRGCLPGWGGPHWAESRPVFRGLLRAYVNGECPPSLHAWSSGLSKAPPHTRPRASPPQRPWLPSHLELLSLSGSGGPCVLGPEQIPCSQPRGFLCDWTSRAAPSCSLLGTQEPRCTVAAGRGPWVQPLCARVNDSLKCPQETQRNRIPAVPGARRRRQPSRLPLSSAPRRQRDRTVAVINPHQFPPRPP